MENSIKANGKITKCMEKAPSNGLMEESILVNISKIKNTDLEEYNGPMEKFIKATGDKVSKMAKVKSEDLMVSKDKEFGKMEKESNEIFINFFYSYLSNPIFLISNFS